MADRIDACPLQGCIIAAIGDSVAEVRDSIIILRQKLVEHAAFPCCEVLRGASGVKQVLLTYRMTSREAHTQGSTYVSATIQPLVRFRAINDDVHACDEGWTQDAVRVLCKDFERLSKEVVESARKTATGIELIKARRKRSNPQNTTGITLSDTQKICTQLLLDVEKMGSAIESKLGIDPESVAEFCTLRSFVRGEIQSPGEHYLARSIK